MLFFQNSFDGRDDGFLVKQFDEVDFFFVFWSEPFVKLVDRTVLFLWKQKNIHHDRVFVDCEWSYLVLLIWFWDSFEWGYFESWHGGELMDFFWSMVIKEI